MKLKSIFLCSRYTAFLLIPLVAPVMVAQVSNPQIKFVASDPTGAACTSHSIQMKTPNGTLYTCQSGHMAAVPSGVISGLTTGTIPEATSPTALGNSPITDNGTAVTVGGGRNLAVGNTVLALPCVGSNDSPAITAALATAATEVSTTGVCVLGALVTIPKSKKLIFGPGIHTVSGIRFSDSTTDQTGIGALECAGSGVTTLILKNAANVDVISQTNFATLTGSNSAFGLFNSAILGCTIDGNRANQSAVSYGIRIYGHQNQIQDVVIQNSYTDGLYSEWGMDSTFAAPQNGLEANLDNIRTIFSGSNGITWRGPHDSVFHNILSWGNGAWGFESDYLAATYNGTGSHIASINTFLNGSGGCYLNTTTIASGSDITCTTAAGWGLLIGANSGASNINGIFAGPIGVEIRSPGQSVSGIISSGTTDALKLNGGSCNPCSIQFQGNTGNQINFASESGATNIIGGSQGALPGTLFSGTPNSPDLISINFSNSVYFQYPSRTVHAGGYAPQFPQSNAVMAVMADGGQTGIIYLDGVRIQTPVPVANLPTCNSGSVGLRKEINDATLATPGSTAVGGGTYTIAAQCTFNSTGSVYSWIID
jgi:hypothetical protein